MVPWGHICDSWGPEALGGEHSAAVISLWLSSLLEMTLAVGAEGPSSSFSAFFVPSPPFILAALSIPGKTAPHG